MKVKKPTAARPEGQATHSSTPWRSSSPQQHALKTPKPHISKRPKGQEAHISSTPWRPRSPQQHALKVKQPIAARPKGQAAHSSTHWRPSNPQQHALKGQKLLAQGNALGIMPISNAPCKGKSFKIHLIKKWKSSAICKAFALTGRAALAQTKTQGVALV